MFLGTNQSPFVLFDLAGLARFAEGVVQADVVGLVHVPLLHGDDLSANPQTASHACWAAEFMTRHPEFSADNAMEIIHAEVGAVFEQVLLDAGVFKRDENGLSAFKKFIEQIQ